ncbi:MAG: Jag N-terminal domain-containing protein [Candidatus Marinarcus sp.]|uniref:Jag N-terminal domain-containing protein n=1 Tax=Candidatus Marinarcus sp. TaxID=3100987 RepID=UPI003B0077F8
MKKFEAKCLEEAYELATNEFNCSITDLNIDIIQQSSKGFLGIGKKSAIIMAEQKRDCRREFRRRDTKYRKNSINIEDVSKKIAENCNNENSRECAKTKCKMESIKATPKIKEKDAIFDNFYTEARERIDEKCAKIFVKKEGDEIIKEIKRDVNNLFLGTCFVLEEIKVEFYDAETIYIEFSGDDSALLIGKEGYRYKALSYILFNWINEKYGLMLRLEIAEFLKNQEEAIHNYLLPVIETINETGSYKTKPLDGILVHIALKRLREEFPDKYVAVKTNQRGDKYVLVNEYRTKQQ